MKDSHVQMSHEWLTMVCDTLTHRTHSHWETFRMILILFGCVLWKTSSSRFVWQCHLHKYGKSWAATFSYASLRSRTTVDLKNLELPHTLPLFIRHIFSTTNFFACSCGLLSWIWWRLVAGAVCQIRDANYYYYYYHWMLHNCTARVVLPFVRCRSHPSHKTKFSLGRVRKRWEKIVFVYQSATRNRCNVCNKERVLSDWPGGPANQKTRRKKQRKLFLRICDAVSRRAATIRRRMYPNTFLATVKSMCLRRIVFFWTYTALCFVHTQVYTVYLCRSFV